MSDDLPLPDAPTTATKRRLRRRLSISSLCPSRPKNRCASSVLKGRRPGKGFSVIRPSRSWLLDSACQEGPSESPGQGFARAKHVRLMRFQCVLIGRFRSGNIEGSCENRFVAPAQKLAEVSQLRQEPLLRSGTPIYDAGVAQS